MEETVTPLIDFETYEANAVNIGTQQRSADMMRFIQEVRDDGLYLIDLTKTDERVRIISKFINQFEPEEVVVASARQYGQRPARMFAEAIGAKYKDRVVGVDGDCSCFSFFANKIATSGEGGIILTDSNDYDYKCRYFKNK